MKQLYIRLPSLEKFQFFVFWKPNWPAADPTRFPMVTLPYAESTRLQIPSQHWGIMFEALLKPASNWLRMPFQYWGAECDPPVLGRA